MVGVRQKKSRYEISRCEGTDVEILGIKSHQKHVCDQSTYLNVYKFIKCMTVVLFYFRIVRCRSIDHVYADIYVFEKFTTSAVLRRTAVSNTLLNLTSKSLHILAATSCKLASCMLELLPMPKS